MIEHRHPLFVPEAATRPLLLDLFCCAGGAAMGYRRAGFDVVGVDHVEQPNYPFHFIRGDALAFLKEHGWEYDAIHASPPCQWQTAYARRPKHVHESPELIGATRAELVRVGKPYVIESPESAAARSVMHAPIRLCGSSFRLDVRRHRLFESDVPLSDRPCEHHVWTRRFKPATNRTNLRFTIEIGSWDEALELQQAAMGGLTWMTREELSQAIPPAYTEHIGRQLIAHLEARRAA